MDSILIFGATGGSGREAVVQALGRGFVVTAVVRNPAAFTLRHDALTIVKGDVLQLSSFEKEMVGKTAVISCLGVGRDFKPTTVYSKGMENILAAMRQANVTRLICLSASALYTYKEMGFFIRLLAKLVVQRILKNPFADLHIMEKTVQASAVDWSIIRPPMLKDKPLTGRYRVAVGTHLARPFSITRADLAHYMLGIVNDARTFRSIIDIAY
jgi:putative NADH-flavin reductase